MDGNTPLHLAILSLAETPRQFEKLKNISKELLFSGASRQIENKDGQTPADLLPLSAEQLDEDDLAKIKYILAQPKGVGLLRMTRPIEKV